MTVNQKKKQRLGIVLYRTADWNKRVSHALLDAKKRGWTQERLAEKLGVSQGSIANWKAGRREPSYKQLEVLCDALGVDPVSVLFGSASVVSPNSIDEKIIKAFEGCSAEMQAAIRRMLDVEVVEDVKKTSNATMV